MGAGGGFGGGERAAGRAGLGRAGGRAGLARPRLRAGMAPARPPPLPTRGGGRRAMDERLPFAVPRAGPALGGRRAHVLHVEGARLGVGKAPARVLALVGAHGIGAAGHGAVRPWLALAHAGLERLSARAALYRRLRLPGQPLPGRAGVAQPVALLSACVRAVPYEAGRRTERPAADAAPGSLFVRPGRRIAGDAELRVSPCGTRPSSTGR